MYNATSYVNISKQRSKKLCLSVYVHIDVEMRAFFTFMQISL